MMGILIHIELEKLFRRGRSYIPVLAVLVIIGVIQVGMMLDGVSLIDFVSENLQEVFILEGNLLNGYLIAFISINGLWIHVPILVVIVTGDMISGEAGAGTFRMVLSRPVSRTRLILAKFLTAMVYVAMLVALLAVLSLGLGILFFGKGDIIVMFESINILPEEILMGRFLMAFLFGMLGMWLVAALSFVFSALAENSLSPIILTMAIIILFTIVSGFEINIFQTIRPYLFTTHMNNWQSFFDFELDWNRIGRSAGVLVLHILAFIAATLVIFRKKDITT